MLTQKKLNAKRAKHRAARKGKKYNHTPGKVWRINTDRIHTNTTTHTDTDTITL